jgi:hypothetical protein
MRVPDDILNCVAFIGPRIEIPEGHQVEFKATGFFVSVASKVVPDRMYVYFVTARHVAEKLAASKFGIRINKKDGEAGLYLGEANQTWWYHPTDKSVDAAAIILAPSQSVFENKTIPTTIAFTEEIMIQQQFGIGDEVFIVGLFTEFGGDKKNSPIVRIGNLAMIPRGEKVPIAEFGDSDVYLIEARSIGGLSGSPVFIRNIFVGTFYWLGLIHGHWDLPSGRKFDFREDADDYEHRSSVNMGISVVVPAIKIIEILNRKELEDRRVAQDQEWRTQNTPTPNQSVG